MSFLCFFRGPILHQFYIVLIHIIFILKPGQKRLFFSPFSCLPDPMSNLGGDCYIHLTTEAYLTLTFLLYSFFCEIAIVFRALAIFSFPPRINRSVSRWTINICYIRYNLRLFYRKKTLISLTFSYFSYAKSLQIR